MYITVYFILYFNFLIFFSRLSRANSVVPSAATASGGGIRIITRGMYTPINPVAGRDSSGDDEYEGLSFTLRKVSPSTSRRINPNNLDNTGALVGNSLETNEVYNPDNPNSPSSLKHNPMEYIYI